MHGVDKWMLRFAFLSKNFIWFLNSDIQSSLRVDSVTDTVVRTSENDLIISPRSK